MLKKIKENRERIFTLVILIIYSLGTLIIVTKHESWSDEAQAWLIARDLNIFGIVKQMQYEGHSCLWHLILFPFAKLGFPFETIKYISWIFCVAAVWVILTKSPFCKILKIIIIFNPIMCYGLPAISRCYCMIPLFMSCICVVYPKKEEKPMLYAIFIALLANTHVIMEPLAAMLIFFFWGEKLIWKRKETDNKTLYWKSFFIACCGILIFVAQVIPAVFNCAIFSQTEKINIINDEKVVMSELRIVIDNMNKFITDNIPWRMNLIWISLLLLAFSFILNPKQSFILIINATFFLFVHTFLWFLIKQRTYVFVLYILFFVWNCDRNKKMFNKVPTYWFSDIALALIIISVMGNFPEIKMDIERKYSSAKDMAEYIKEEVPKGSVFISPCNERVATIIPYLKKEDYIFYSSNAKRYYTFVTWDDDYKKQSTMKNIEESVEKLKKEGIENIYVLNSKYTVFVEMTLQHDKYEKVYEADDSYHDYFSQYEDYYLYKVNL